MVVWRLKFSIKGRQAYLSHLDMLTLWERALRRGGIPVRYSQGFNPHMQIAFGPAHAVGVEAEGDYVDIETDEGLDAAVWRNFDSCLPDGVSVLDARILEPGTPSLMQSVNTADYTLRLTPFDTAAAERAVKDFFAADSVLFERKTPKSTKSIEFRPCVKSIEIENDIIRVRIRMSDRGTPRPFEIAALIAPEARVLRCCRTALWIEQADGGLLLP